MNRAAWLTRAVSYPDEVQGVIAADLEALAARAHRPLRVLDVGCGTTSMLARFHQKAARQRCRLIGLDAHGSTIDWCRRHGFHDEYVRADASDADALPPVDVIVATDLVEHFDKPSALALIAAFEQRAARAVLLFTPNGYVVNPFDADNPFMEHKCGFAVAELEALGYACTGLGGPRWMRGPQSLPRGPKVVSWPALAVLSRCMRGLPAQSFHIYARKQRVDADVPMSR
jgi:SAM-dependent methyltransferase